MRDAQEPIGGSYRKPTMASATDKVQSRLQEAMDHGNQASLGQAIDASKGVNGLKQLRRSAKVQFEAIRLSGKYLFTRIRCLFSNQLNLSCDSCFGFGLLCIG